MIRTAFALTAVVLCSAIGGRIHGAEHGFPAGLAGKWQMTKLVCAGCALTGALPGDLAGGSITIGADTFDDPLTGACPGPRFKTEPPVAFSRYLANTGASGLGPLERLAPHNASVLSVAVICQSPPGARIAAGAITKLDLLAPDILIRAWTDRSYVILKRLPRRD